MAINVGGLAKGYAVDRAISILRGMVPNGIVNAGGDLFAFGQKNKQNSWTIGLQHPRKPQEPAGSFCREKPGQSPPPAITSGIL